MASPNNPHDICTWRPVTECADCPIAGHLKCRFNRRHLLHFLGMFGVFAIPAFIGVIQGGYGWYLLGWVAFWLIFFELWEIRILCSHCPYYAEKGRTLHCIANYGSLKVWEYRPGPMSTFGKVQLWIGFAILGGYPFPFMILGGQYLWAIAALGIWDIFLDAARVHVLAVRELFLSVEQRLQGDRGRVPGAQSRDAAGVGKGWSEEVAMMKKAIFAGLLTLAVLLAGCGPGAEVTPTVDWSADYVPVVSVTGEVLPAVWADVSAQAGGTVVEVLVEPGDEVVAGDLLVCLDPADAELAVQQAEATLEVAQAELALLEAEPRAEEIAATGAKVDAAEAALAQAIAQRDQLDAGQVSVEVAEAEAAVTTATADELVARETHDKTMECIKWRGRTICPGLGPYEESARYSLQAATGALEAAQAQLAALQAGAAERIAAANAAVEAATAQRDAAQAQLDLLRAGATDEEIAAQQAVVDQAQVALDEAQVALERTEVHAPFAGTVGMVDTRVGELVVPGQPLVTLGDLATLRVETTDLDEIDVARVAVGQQVDLSFDALPEEVFVGYVTRISPMAASESGGVNYTVVIVLEGDIDPAIRWGMTAFVDIEVGQ
jgi:multidrug resistance efflux pump